MISIGIITIIFTFVVCCLILYFVGEIRINILTNKKKRYISAINMLFSEFEKFVFESKDSFQCYKLSRTVDKINYYARSKNKFICIGLDDIPYFSSRQLKKIFRICVNLNSTKDTKTIREILNKVSL